MSERVSLLPHSEGNASILSTTPIKSHSTLVNLFSPHRHITLAASSTSTSTSSSFSATTPFSALANQTFNYLSTSSTTTPTRASLPPLSRLNSFLNPNKQSLSVFQFSMIAFFLVCGGPFGLELTVLAGGPLYTFIGFFLLPLLWSIPQALITAEMSCLIRNNGGYVLWVATAFGEFAGWLSGLNGSVSYIFDLALYPSLCASYAAILFPQLASPDATYLVFAVKVSVVLLCLLINMCGLKQVGNMNAVITVMVITPFIISGMFQWRKVIGGGEAFLMIPKREEIDWAVLVSTLLWAYSGWDSLGNMAGEIEDPAYIYTRGSVLTLCMVTLTYALPTFISIQTHPDLSEWVNGSLASFASDVSPSLGIATVIASMCSNVGMYNAGLSASARAMQAMAKGGMEDEEGEREEKEDDEEEEEEGREKEKEKKEEEMNGSTAGSEASSLPSRSWSPRSLSCSSLARFFSSSFFHCDTPIVALLFHSLLIISLLSFDFSTLVQADVLLTCFRLLFEFAAFVKFRYSEPHKSEMREFLVPGGWVGVGLITSPALLIVGGLCWSADGLTWLFAVTVNVGGVLAYAVKKWLWPTKSGDEHKLEEKQIPRTEVDLQPKIRKQNKMKTHLHTIPSS